MHSLREASSSLLQNLVASRPNMRMVIDRESLVSAGKALWPMTYKGASSDAEAFERYCAFAQTLIAGLQSDNEEDRISGTIGSAMLLLPMEQMTYFWSCCWADQAFPSVTMGHKYAASLMSTSIAPELVADVVPPYKAFLIEVPNKLLEVEDQTNGTLAGIRYVLVHYLITSNGPTWSYVALTDGTTSIWRHGVPVSEIAEEDPENITTWDHYSFALETTDRDERLHVLIGRLLVGACLALSSRDYSKPIGKSHGVSDGVLRTSDEPLVRTFQIGRPVKIDCRQVVHDYVAGIRNSAPGVQKLLRGHWQRYYFGPRPSSVCRWLHKEPYWRGPEDAPILVSSLKLSRD